MRALRIAGVIAVNVALALVAAEGLLRVVEPVPQTGLQIQPCIFEYDAKLGYRYRPGAQGKLVRFHEIENWVEINDSGFHDVPWPAEKRDGVQRVVAFGDSFTASLHVPADETWTRTLEASLNDPSGVRRFEVLNAGLSGTGTRTHAGLMDELLPALAPDIVLLMFFANDVSDFTRGVVYYECVDGMILAYQNDAQKSEELRLIAERYDHPALNRWTEKLLVLQFLNY